MVSVTGTTWGSRRRVRVACLSIGPPHRSVAWRLASLWVRWRCRAGIGCIGRPQLEPIREAAQRRPLFGQPDGGRRGPWRGARVVCGVLDPSRI